MLETPSTAQCLAMIKDFATSSEFKTLSPRHMEYIARIELYFLNSSRELHKREAAAVTRVVTQLRSKREECIFADGGLQQPFYAVPDSYFDEMLSQLQ
jgi:hypothetical protein